MSESLDQMRERLARETEAFLAKGGVISEIPDGVTAEPYPYVVYDGESPEGVDVVKTPATEKACAECLKIKDIREFSKTLRGCINPSCKICVNMLQRIRRSLNKEEKANAC